MVFLGANEDGEQELYCPICGRRLLVKWPPNYQKIVLEPGDINAVHSGGTGGLSVHAPRVTTRQDDRLEAPELEPDGTLSDHTLAPFIVWMEQTGFDSLWD